MFDQLHLTLNFKTVLLNKWFKLGVFIPVCFIELIKKMTNVGWNYKMLNYINYNLLKNYLKNIS